MLKYLKINTTTNELELDSTQLGTEKTGNHEFIIYKGSNNKDNFLIGLDNDDYEGWYLYYDKTNLKFKMGDFSNKTIRSDEKTICEYQSLFFKLVKPTESSESTDCVDTAWDAPNKTDSNT